MSCSVGCYGICCGVSWYVLLGVMVCAVGCGEMSVGCDGMCC